MHVLGDLRTAVAGPAQAIQAGQQGGGMGALVVTRHGTTEAMRAGHAPSPRPRPLARCTVLVHLDGDAIHQPPHDRLAVLRGRVRGVPQGWDVVRHTQDRLPRTGRHLRGTLASEPRIRRWEVWRVTERRFPAPLQLPGDEAVFGRDGFVRSGRPLGIVARARKALVPMGLSALACRAQGLLRRDTHRSRRRLEHL